MAHRPPLDSPVTVVVAGQLVHAYVGGPSFNTCGEVSFPYTNFPRASHGEDWVFVSTEGSTWARGHLSEDSPDGLALLAASRLAS